MSWTAIRGDAGTKPPAPDAPPLVPARPWRELGWAVVIFVLSGAAGLLFVWALPLLDRLGGPGWSYGSAEHKAIAMIGATQLAWIALVLGRARWAAGGIRMADFAAGPGKRLWLVGVVIAAELALLGYNVASELESPLCGLGLHVGTSGQLLALSRETPVWLALLTFEISVLAAISEELLFRGWLWTVLQRSWGAWPAALVTGGMFWLLHAPEGLRSFLLLLPVAIVLTVVRQFTGSIRGTIVLHAVHNGGLVMLTMVLLRGC